MDVEEKRVLKDLLWALKRNSEFYQTEIEYCERKISPDSDIHTILKSYFQGVKLGSEIANSHLKVEIKLVEESMSKNKIGDQQDILIKLTNIVQRFNRKDPIRKNFMYYYGIKDSCPMEIKS